MTMLRPETIDGSAPFPFDLPAYDATGELLAEREQKWGKPEICWSRVAQVWSGILGFEVTAHQASLCMVGMKLVRADLCPDEPDSLDDAAGYVRIAQRVMRP